MNEEQLIQTWTMLEPSAPQLRRIDARVSAWLDAHDTSLASEWLELFRVAPLPAFGLVFASAVALIFATPLAWVARAMM